MSDTISIKDTGNDVIMFSPHCDDIPLSLGGALLMGSFGNNVIINNVFSVSKHTKEFRCTGDEFIITQLLKIFSIFGNFIEIIKD